eukprot:4128483-Pleurochrysis_carterae.AAC.12
MRCVLSGTSLGTSRRAPRRVSGQRRVPANSGRRGALAAARRLVPRWRHAAARQRPQRPAHTPQCSADVLAFPA